MQIIEVSLPGVFILEPKRFGDARGFFAETWNRRTMAEAGLDHDFVQDNHSLSAQAYTGREIIRAGYLPDFDLAEEEGDTIRVTPKAAVVDPGQGRDPQLSPDALDEVRSLMPGSDVYALGAGWRAMGKKPLRSPDKAFLGWVKRRA